MPIPDYQTLLLPILRLLADDAEHSSEKIREVLAAQFNVAPHELIQKNQKGKTVFGNNVDLALANLQGAPHGRSKCIDRIRKGVYRINERGKAILKRNPLTLTVKDL
jgi:restriction system protein